MPRKDADRVYVRSRRAETPPFPRCKCRRNCLLSQESTSAYVVAHYFQPPVPEQESSASANEMVTKLFGQPITRFPCSNSAHQRTRPSWYTPRCEALENQMVSNSLFSHLELWLDDELQSANECKLF